MQDFEEFIYHIERYELQTNLSEKEIELGFKYCNGCGAKGGFHFPGTIWGVNIEACCNLHDMEWNVAKTLEDLFAANERLDNNLKTICDIESNVFMQWVRRQRIAKYVSGVELIGTPLYAQAKNLIHEVN